jgi:Ca-activated chloride channel homolog
MSDELDKLFNTAANTRPRGHAKRQAKDAAMAVFVENQKNAEHAKGKPDQQRPTADNVVNFRRRMMQNFNNRWLVSGLASAALLVVTVSVLFTVGTPSPEIADDRNVALKESDSLLGEVVVTASREGERFGDISESEDMALSAASPASEPLAVRRETFYPGSERQQLAKTAGQSSGVANLVAGASDRLKPVSHYDRDRDRFEHVTINPVHLVSAAPVSTFSIDVDTASYSFVRRQLNQGLLPPKDAVRVEEMINYFDYDYPLPTNSEKPFKATVNVVDSPWRKGNKLVHIGIGGYELPADRRPDSNLVFLLDVSGSMNSPDKLPLVKQSMGLLLDQLKPTDSVAIVVYAGAAGTVLEPTAVKDKQKILAALHRLNAGGSTAGGEGIKLAYHLAEANYREEAVNRVILATDGDFNVGITDNESLQGFVERKRNNGIFLTVLGFGQGNYHDDRMQALAQNGNGAAAYIDTLGEAQKVLVKEATSTLFPIAKDVKLQVEFNPATVSEYRLLGYETRMLNREDFNNDKVDAGDIGAGHRVTAIYEITPVGASSGLMGESRYAGESAHQASVNGEYGYLKIRYKLPSEDRSKLIQTAIEINGKISQNQRQEVNFATAVAGFAEILKGGVYLGDWDYDDVLAIAMPNRGMDPYGYRAEFVQLVRKAKTASAM